jgi:hypothetical protein
MTRNRVKCQILYFNINGVIFFKKISLGCKDAKIVIINRPTNEEDKAAHKTQNQ